MRYIDGRRRILSKFEMSVVCVIIITIQLNPMNIFPFGKVFIYYIHPLIMFDRRYGYVSRAS